MWYLDERGNICVRTQDGHVVSSAMTYNGDDHAAMLECLRMMRILSRTTSERMNDKRAREDDDDVDVELRRQSSGAMR